MTLSTDAKEEMNMALTGYLSEGSIISIDVMKRVSNDNYEVIIFVEEKFGFSSKFGEYAESNGYFTKYEEEIRIYCSYYDDYTGTYRNYRDFTNNKDRFNYFANVYGIVNDIIIKDIITDLYNAANDSYVVLK